MAEVENRALKIAREYRTFVELAKPKSDEDLAILLCGEPASVLVDLQKAIANANVETYGISEEAWMRIQNDNFLIGAWMATRRAK